MRFDRRAQSGIARIARRNQNIAQEARVAEPLHRAAGEQAAESGLVKRQPVADPRLRQIGPRPQLGLAGLPRPFVPGADRKAIVAAVDAVADGAAKLQRDRALVLDREIGDAPAWVEAIGRGKGLRRADVEACAE